MKIDKTIKIAGDSNLPCLLVGQHGTGKSYSITQEAKRKKVKLHRLIITQETTPEDLVCSYELEESKGVTVTKMIKHALLEAAEKGEWIVFEEINMGSPAVLTLLNGLLETDPDSRFIKFQDLEVKPHKEFRMFATANPTGYSGANKMNDALLSRFLVHNVQPDYKAFLNIITAKFGNTIGNKAKKFLSAIKKVQKNYEIYISPRELLVYAQLIEDKVSHADATQLIIGRHYDLEQDVLKEMMALFDVEMARAEIHVFNEVELKKKMNDAVSAIEGEVVKLRAKTKKLEGYKEKYEKVQKAFAV